MKFLVIVMVVFYGLNAQESELTRLTKELDAKTKTLDAMYKRCYKIIEESTGRVDAFSKMHSSWYNFENKNCIFMANLENNSTNKEIVQKKCMIRALESKMPDYVWDDVEE
jgi:uncharacterized protein YecT (DUF1311 family)